MLSNNQVEIARDNLMHGQTETVFAGDIGVWFASGTVSVGSVHGFRRDAYAQTMARDCKDAAGKVERLNLAILNRRAGDDCVCL